MDNYNFILIAMFISLGMVIISPFLFKLNKDKKKVTIVNAYKTLKPIGAFLYYLSVFVIILGLLYEYILTGKI